MQFSCKNQYEMYVEKNKNGNSMGLCTIQHLNDISQHILCSFTHNTTNYQSKYSPQDNLQADKRDTQTHRKIFTQYSRGLSLPYPTTLREDQQGLRVQGRDLQGTLRVWDSYVVWAIVLIPTQWSFFWRWKKSSHQKKTVLVGASYRTNSPYLFLCRTNFPRVPQGRGLRVGT